jgi:phosphotransferase system HPr (HPr) family protein
LLIALQEQAMKPDATRDVEIVGPYGLHVRPAHDFAVVANRFDSTIELIRDNERVNGKSTLDILLLAAKEGTTLTIVATGRDAREAVDELAKLFQEQVAAVEPDDSAGDGKT